MIWAEVKKFVKTSRIIKVLNISQTMEISSQTTPRLLGLNNLPIEELRTLCKYFLQALISGHSTADIDEDLQPETLALSIFLLEVSKVRSSSDTVRWFKAVNKFLIYSWKRIVDILSALNSWSAQAWLPPLFILSTPEPDCCFFLSLLLGNCFCSKDWTKKFRT